MSYLEPDTADENEFSEESVDEMSDEASLNVEDISDIDDYHDSDDIQNIDDIQVYR